MLFHSKDAYSEMEEKLTELYDFRNNNNSATIASTTAEGEKFVLTLYKNKKLLIQSAGEKTWKSTIFVQISNELKEYVGKPSETDSIKFKISSKTTRGKKDSTKRHHHRHHKRQPGEQQFPTQVVTG